MNAAARPCALRPAGIADATDVLRPAYLLEHLIAVGAARGEGIPVAGCARVPAWQHGRRR
jgi:beta-glucosidase/6-phospho-beta-glucosidase/beta-galactosidase